MKTYLGEIIVEKEKTIFKEYGKYDWMLYFIEQYGQIDGDHHMRWVLDQIVRIMKSTPVIIKLATWDDGSEEYRISTGTPSEEYIQWVNDMKYGEDGDDTYDYDEGVAP